MTDNFARSGRSEAVCGYCRGGSRVPKQRVVDIVEQLALPIVAESGLELVDVEYKKEGTHWYLRVFIDRPEGGVDIDDCSRVSERLSERLDEVDPIPTSYFLEVSSPGAERPLKKPADFARSVGRRVHLSLYEPVSGQRQLEGVLLRFDGDTLELEQTVKNRKQTVSVPLQQVAKARRAVEL
ncbi:MAG: ribosome maturation factor RimP [Alicyclobacillaceae bacterium]|nr:ribosome maturation factor RimP [Alicyclobacillaceae bacterium]